MIDFSVFNSFSHLKEFLESMLSIPKLVLLNTRGQTLRCNFVYFLKILYFSFILMRDQSWNNGSSSFMLVSKGKNGYFFTTVEWWQTILCMPRMYIYSPIRGMDQDRVPKCKFQFIFLFDLSTLYYIPSFLHHLPLNPNKWSS